MSCLKHSSCDSTTCSNSMLLSASSPAAFDGESASILGKTPPTQPSNVELLSASNLTVHLSNCPASTFAAWFSEASCAISFLSPSSGSISTAASSTMTLFSDFNDSANEAVFSTASVLELPFAFAILGNGSGCSSSTGSF
eukprot:CAMPEP_0172895298 /NCGR_PEP_ID=MMETSP1075-20121228/152821_1 /TAXON_ID=2916 /ORGANISM="Ceratium fusus, Strain PA161109" /LENGTH=139 /DNA_ID=CAMNT_0013750499 /DNA_START=73 /DNA_END=492 /DNA_ORIENTATION=+